MDEFLSELYVEYFKKWILLQTSKDYKLYFNDNDSNIILIEAENSLSTFLEGITLSSDIDDLEEGEELSLIHI